MFWYDAGSQLHFGQRELVRDPKPDRPDRWVLMLNLAAIAFISDSGFKVPTESWNVPRRSETGVVREEGSFSIICGYSSRVARYRRM